jgi:hypothetical protein
MTVLLSQEKMLKYLSEDITNALVVGIGGCSAGKYKALSETLTLFDYDFLSLIFWLQLLHS